MLRWVLLAATCLVVLALLGMYGSTVYFIRKAFARRVQACKTVPEDLGLKAETIAISSSDGIPLKGWWVPAEQLRGSVIVLHGMDGLDASCLLPPCQVPSRRRLVGLFARCRLGWENPNPGPNQNKGISRR